MAKNSNKNMIGAWAFLIGVILAVILGVFQSYMSMRAVAILYPMIVVLGLIVGFLNIANKDSVTFLFASLSLVIVSAFGQSVLGYVPYVNTTLASLLTMFVPATIIVALRTVFEIAKT